MERLKVCSQINLHKCRKDDIEAYIKNGISFMKKAGFDCMDFPVKEIYSLLPYEKLWKKEQTALNKAEKALNSATADFMTKGASSFLPSLPKEVIPPISNTARKK